MRRWGTANPGQICETNMTISDITVLHGLIRPCPARDIAEPVEFSLNGRFRITISRFHDSEPITAERLAKIITESLQSEGITVV
jgi:hypothetical protein